VVHHFIKWHLLAHGGVCGFGLFPSLDQAHLAKDE
jgi:hypothetical protein